MSRVTYGPEGSQILIIDGVYYLAADVGNTLYVVQVPEGWNLKQLTDATLVELTNKDKLYKDLVASGDILELTSDEFYGKVAYEDRIVMLDTDMVSLSEDYEDVDTMTATIQGLQDLKTNASFWSSSNYMNSLEDWVIENGIDNIANYWDSQEHRDAIANEGLTVDQYNAQTKKARDRLGWEEDVENYVIELSDYAIDLEGEVSENIVRYVAEQWASGWSEAKAKMQIKKLIDSEYKLGVLDPKVLAMSEGADIKGTTKGQTTIQDLMDEYLAPQLHTRIDIKKEAGKIRNNPAYEDTFIAKLKSLTKNQYGMYDEDIAIGLLIDSKISTFEKLTGILLDKTKPSDFSIIDKMLRLNDYGQEAQIARQEGYNRGSQVIENEIYNAMGATFGKGIIGKQDYSQNRSML